MKDYPVRWITTEVAVGYAPRSYNDLAAIWAQGIGEKLGVSKAGLAEIQEEIEPPSDSFFKKWEAMLDFFKS